MCYVSRVKLDFIFLALHWAKKYEFKGEKAIGKPLCIKHSDSERKLFHF